MIVLDVTLSERCGYTVSFDQDLIGAWQLVRCRYGKDGRRGGMLREVSAGEAAPEYGASTHASASAVTRLSSARSGMSR